MQRNCRCARPSPVCVRTTTSFLASPTQPIPSFSINFSPHHRRPLLLLRTQPHSFLRLCPRLRTPFNLPLSVRHGACLLISDDTWRLSRSQSPGPSSNFPPQPSIFKSTLNTSRCGSSAAVHTLESCVFNSCTRSQISSAATSASRACRVLAHQHRNFFDRSFLHTHKRHRFAIAAPPL